MFRANAITIKFISVIVSFWNVYNYSFMIILYNLINIIKLYYISYLIIFWVIFHLNIALSTIRIYGQENEHMNTNERSFTRTSSYHVAKFVNWSDNNWN